MNINESELRNIIREEIQNLNEASEISLEELETSKKRIVQNLQRVLDVKGIESIWEGIHGNIVVFNHNSIYGSYRFDVSIIKLLSKLKIRWIESDDTTVSIAF